MNNPTTTNLARIVDVIYLHPTTNLQGGHEIMDISNDRLTTRPKVYPCVMTKIFIKAIEKLVEYQGFKTLKTFNRKKKEIIFPNDDLLGGGLDKK